MTHMKMYLDFEFGRDDVLQLDLDKGTEDAPGGTLSVHHPGLLMIARTTIELILGRINLNGKIWLQGRYVRTIHSHNA